jgi:glycerol-3-phosphate dehydrogenase
LVVGGGINGVGIARDAAGRGLSVILCEQGDLGCATSSASSKLVHGGLRYLEQLEFRLVAEALAEREVLLRAAPHLVQPMRFVMPHAPGLRPAWVIRAGLFLYDWLARRDTLDPSSAIDLRTSAYGRGMQRRYARGYVYSDCWVDDARLVIANALAAAEAGAEIRTRTACVAALREGDRWRARLRNATGEVEVVARGLVNAAGPWVAQFLIDAVGEPAGERLKLVQGSHIVVPRLYEGTHACILQNDDGRVVFVYPYEDSYTLIGTTDVELAGEPRACSPGADEIAYLCRAANRYFDVQIGAADVHWSYCGVRALADAGTAEPSKLSRDYLLRLDAPPGQAPLLSVFGGKITTYRRLAERALERLGRVLNGVGERWTAGVPLPGGDAPDVDAHVRSLVTRYPSLPPSLVHALGRRHGSRTAAVLGNSQSEADLGECFGADLYAREVDYFIEHEWAREGDDVLWRRTKAGLHLSVEERQRIVHYVAARAEACVR